MQKTDIMQENPCIQRIISVIQGSNPHHHKLIKIDGRHSDAFVYVVEGNCTYRFDDKIEFTANDGDVFYLPNRSVYSMYIHTSDYKVIFCDFEFLQNAERRPALYPNRAKKNVDMLFEKLLNRHRSSAHNAGAECMSILYNIYSILQQDADKDYIGKSREAVVTEAKRFIDDSFGKQDFSISSLAKSIGISEVYLRKLFKAQYGLSPSAYLMSVRLKKAKILMKYPFLTLEECALQSGFSSLQYFCRLFKQEIGIPPGKFRKEL